MYIYYCSAELTELVNNYYVSSVLTTCKNYIKLKAINSHYIERNLSDKLQDDIHIAYYDMTRVYVCNCLKNIYVYKQLAYIMNKISSAPLYITYDVFHNLNRYLKAFCSCYANRILLVANIKGDMSELYTVAKLTGNKFYKVRITHSVKDYCNIKYEDIKQYYTTQRKILASFVNVERLPKINKE